MAFVANVAMLVALVTELLASDVSISFAVTSALLVLASFVLAAGLAGYGGGSETPFLAVIATVYSSIASVLLVLSIFDSTTDEGGDEVVRQAVVLLLAIVIVELAMTTGWLAQIPVRTLAIPLIAVALFLTVFAALIVIGLDPPAVLGDDRPATLGRLLAALVTVGVAIGVLLGMGRVPGLTGQPGSATPPWRRTRPLGDP